MNANFENLISLLPPSKFVYFKYNPGANFAQEMIILFERTE